jgi:hypothetical protein
VPKVFLIRKYSMPWIEIPIHEGSLHTHALRRQTHADSFLYIDDYFEDPDGT